MSRAWLLVLGSDDAGGAPIAAALEALAKLGQVEPLTGPRRSPDAEGADRWFTNRLVRLDSALAREELVEQVQRIERDIGRSEHSDEVPIDIDLLAHEANGDAWRLDSYAADKGEQRRAHVMALLEEAGITL
ncbi:2-amino-4-hydroxy-6-hydroxymethyldihydropteridine diphosphokinase [Luteimonas sp. A478]